MSAELQVVEGREHVPPHGYVVDVAVTPEQAVDVYESLREITRKALKEGTDYGVIPGTPKPTLLKPGAENLLRFFGLGHRIHPTDKITDFDKGFFYFAYKVTVHKTLPNGTEIVLAECEGSANSKESRYAARWVPQWKLKEYNIHDVSGLESRERENNRGKYKEYKIQNRDPYTLVNTLQKMAIKRALVGATLQATGASGLFTQDEEDIVDNIVKNKTYQSKQASQTSNQNNNRITENQLNAIYKIAESKGVDRKGIEKVAEGQYGKLTEIDKSNASDLIKLLNSIDKNELQSLVDSYQSNGGKEGNTEDSEEVIDIPGGRF